MVPSLLGIINQENIFMSNLSAKILRSIVAAEYNVKPENIRISGYVSELDSKKEWFGFYHSLGFMKIEPFSKKPLFLLSVYEGIITSLIAPLPQFLFINQ